MIWINRILFNKISYIKEIRQWTIDISIFSFYLMFNLTHFFDNPLNLFIYRRYRKNYFKPTLKNLFGSGLSRLGYAII
jgi:hypothetical protein